MLTNPVGQPPREAHKALSQPPKNPAMHGFAANELTLLAGEEREGEMHRALFLGQRASCPALTDVQMGVYQNRETTQFDPMEEGT